MSFWLSLSSAMPHTSFAGECPSWSAFFGRYEGFSTRCAGRQTPHPVRDATAYFGEFTFHALWCISFRSMRENPPGGTMIVVADPLEILGTKGEGAFVSVEENKALARRFLEALVTGNLKVM